MYKDERCIKSFNCSWIKIDLTFPRCIPSQGWSWTQNLISHLIFRPMNINSLQTANLCACTDTSSICPVWSNFLSLWTLGIHWFPFMGRQIKKLKFVTKSKPPNIYLQRMIWAFPNCCAANLLHCTPAAIDKCLICPSNQKSPCKKAQTKPKEWKFILLPAGRWYEP